MQGTVTPDEYRVFKPLLDEFDGFSIGSSDLTQLVLGVDRDSQVLKTLFDEHNEAVKRTISDLISTAHASGTPVGVGGKVCNVAVEGRKTVSPPSHSSISLGLTIE